MSRYHEAAAGVSGETPADSARCHAFGCPLPGGISESTKGGGPWLCRHHFGAAASQWADITTRLRRELAHQGDLVTTEPSVPNAVQRIRAEIAELQERRAAARRDREPGEDDE